MGKKIKYRFFMRLMDTASRITLSFFLFVVQVAKKSPRRSRQVNSQPCRATDYSLLRCRRNRKEDDLAPIGGIQLVAS